MGFFDVLRRVGESGWDREFPWKKIQKRRVQIGTTIDTLIGGTFYSLSNSLFFKYPIDLSKGYVFKNIHYISLTGSATTFRFDGRVERDMELAAGVGNEFIFLNGALPDFKDLEVSFTNNQAPHVMHLYLW